MGIIQRNGVTYGSVPPINGTRDSIIVGDGNNWAKGNIYNYKIDYIWLDPSTVTTGGPSNFAVAHYAQTIPSTFGVMTEVMAPNNQPFNPPRYVLKSGFTTRDDAKQKIAGKAQINIGEDNTDYTSDNRKFWSTSLTGPKIDIGGTAVIEMNGTGKGSSNSDTPVISMRGRCLIDICGSRPTASQEIGYGRARTASWWPNVMPSNEQDPFDPTKRLYNNTVAYPYLHMHDESTVIMEGAPILNMRGNSLLSINGDVCIDINGRNPINRGSKPGAAAGYGDVAIDIRPGTAIQIGTGDESTSSNPSTSMIKLTHNQFIVASALPKETNVSGTSCISQLCMDTTNGYATSYEGELFPFKYTSHGGTYGLFNFFDGPIAKWDPSTMNQRIGQWASSGVWGDGPGKNVGPVVWMQGKSRLKIGDSGTFSAVLGGLGNVSISMEPQYGSSAEVYMASSAYSADVINIANENNSFTTFHHGAAVNAATKYEFTPAGNTLVRFSPRKKFYVNINSTDTEMICQWQQMYGFFQGQNNYVLLDGKQTHIENVGNTFIMRDDTTKEDYETGEGSKYSKFFKVYNYNNGRPIDVEGTLPSSSEEFAQSQLGQSVINDFNSHKSALANSELIHNVKPLLAIETYSIPESNYDPTKKRYYDINYPTQFTLYGQNTVIEFDSTTSWGSDRTTYYSVPTTAYVDTDVIQAIKDNLGPDIAQYFYKLYQGSMQYKRTTNGSTYHYTLRYPYVELRQTFTYSYATSSVPSAPAAYTTISSNYLVYQDVIQPQYNSTTLPTGWTLYYTSSTSSELRMFTYIVGTVDTLNKWQRYAQVQYSVAPDYYETIDYRKPIQTDGSGGTKPVLQMYNRSNLMMRADTIFKPFYNEYIQRPLTTLETYEFTPTDSYTGLITNTIVVHTDTSHSSIQAFLTSDDYRTFVEAVETQYPGDTVAGVISWSKASASGGGYDNTIVFVLASVRRACELEIATFINSTDYTAFETYLTTEYPTKKLWRIAYLEAAQNNKFNVRFGLQDLDETEFLKDPSGDEPILEMVGKSQLRMYNGAYIKGESKLGETTFTFGSTTTNESSVSFTLTELAALKDMLINPPQSFIPLTQAEYDQLDPPDPDTLYVITDGATAQMLPDASVEEF